MPTVVGDSVVVGSCSGNFYVLNRRTGDLQWSYNIHQDGKQTSFHGDPLITKDGLVILGTDFSCAPDGIGYVYAFDVKRHTVSWKRKFGSGISTPLIKGPDGALYFGDVKDNWYKADSHTGVLIWEFHNPEQSDCDVANAPLIIGKRVYLLNKNGGQIYVLSSESGKQVGTVETPSRASTALASYKGLILVGANDGWIYSIDARRLSVKRLVDLKGTPAGRMRIESGHALVFSKQQSHGAITAISLPDRKVIWTQTADREWTSGKPQVWHGLVLAGNCRGQLAAFSLHAGRAVWSTQLSGCIRSIGMRDDTLFVGVQKGMLFAITTSDIRRAERRQEP